MWGRLCVRSRMKQIIANISLTYSKTVFEIEESEKLLASFPLSKSCRRHFTRGKFPSKRKTLRVYVEWLLHTKSHKESMDDSCGKSMPINQMEVLLPDCDVRLAIGNAYIAAAVRSWLQPAINFLEFRQIFCIILTLLQCQFLTNDILSALIGFYGIHRSQSREISAWARTLVLTKLFFRRKSGGWLARCK